MLQQELFSKDRFVTMHHYLDLVSMQLIAYHTTHPTHLNSSNFRVQPNCYSRYSTQFTVIHSDDPNSLSLSGLDATHATCRSVSASQDVLFSTRISRSETGPEFASPSSISTSSPLESPAPLSSPPLGQEAQGRAEQLLQTRAEDAVSLRF